MEYSLDCAGRFLALYYYYPYYRFCFTQIDENEPSRKFSFALQADDLDLYGVQECNPPIDEDALSRYLHDLNLNDDLGVFIKKMRSAFVELAQQHQH